MSKRLHGQSQAGLEYTQQLRDKVARLSRKEKRALCAALTGNMEPIDRIIVLPVLQVGDWRPVKGKYK